MNSRFQNKKYIAEINVTPFVDVMLVLLVIFMVTAPLLVQGIKVDVPETKTVRTLKKGRDKIIITIDKDKNIFIDKYKLEIDKLTNYLKKIVLNKDQMVFLKADKNIPYGFIVKIMGYIKDAGIEKLGIIAEPETKNNK
ncbi:protein TolR [Desulfothermus okinawensis JCM 13304]